MDPLFLEVCGLMFLATLVAYIVKGRIIVRNCERVS